MKDGNLLTTSSECGTLFLSYSDYSPANRGSELTSRDLKHHPAPVLFNRTIGSKASPEGGQPLRVREGNYLCHGGLPPVWIV